MNRRPARHAMTTTDVTMASLQPPVCDFTYVDDVARANLLAADAGSEADGAVVNVGSGRPITVNEVLRSVERALGRSADPIREPQRRGDVRRTHADAERARTLLGWEPRADWEEAVAATVQWFVKGARRRD